MGATNIHHGGQVLQRAGLNLADQAVIAYFGKGVLLVGRAFEQEEVDDFARALHNPHRNKWVEYDGSDANKPVPSDKSVPIPTLHTSPGLIQDRGVYTDGNGQNIELAYVIIVQGASGSLFSKVRVFYSYFAVAAGIMEEALHGMGVAFSAAMLKRDVPKLGGGLPFKKVDSLKHLIAAVDEKRVADDILLCC